MFGGAVSMHRALMRNLCAPLALVGLDRSCGAKTEEGRLEQSRKFGMRGRNPAPVRAQSCSEYSRNRAETRANAKL